ncbi:hypothetical protein [Candidatus Nitrososphaera gargensis]|uniref:hypothetical protein n=1 Tax=Candidatus Nitrososphaera gargensis TaxID=497727 RepID=UPI00164F61F7|nr:hypothetical protein [Candidatus Nitrososphaera gargensis]
MSEKEISAFCDLVARLLPTADLNAVVAAAVIIVIINELRIRARNNWRPVEQQATT